MERVCATWLLPNNKAGPHLSCGEAPLLAAQSSRSGSCFGKPRFAVITGTQDHDFALCFACYLV